ncbi:hypothetical protein OJ996_17535 [Luteolibacter sp. GHJ8]|jgi:hypothetical protein|uniref:DUF2269 family protein n=1 Tax=Luteolibacter rhizosphaerae TaxID=2989719 RepID=A0ABT3G7D1_9BACT|nr:hypothetical protein [Luteolibacter rhizosphaerae]MCW1915391.1 hypothetical protein [Luteolibacter rhizosphaerae]
MDPFLLKTLHIVGALGAFAGIGAIIAAADDKHRKLAGALHGISLLVLLLMGFAMLKKPPMDQHWWQVKLVIWLFIGAAPAFAKRKVLPAGALVGICLALGATAAYLALAKPF